MFRTLPRLLRFLRISRSCCQACNAALANISYTQPTASRQMMRIPGIAKSVTVCANLGIRSLISCESQLMPHRSKHANSSPSSANVRPCVRMSEYSVAQCLTCATSNTYCQQVCDCQRPFAGIPHSFCSSRRLAVSRCSA